ncbi:hypothetical protein [Lederbergia lenta]|uniref:hypothetical protein n=1 Tax=Lederbergia lenta TaxID=1467 RepID=UPI00203CEC8B|nr:hypothetical protein [Lederbergia lenta]MCM3110035.1 hypothetical protein [Lederbergia lenta]
MGMYENMQDILKTLRFDEELLRLLHYKPENIATKTPDPLDSSIENIMDMDISKQWEIRDDKILLTPKDDDLLDKRICRIFVYFGDRNPERGKYLFASQSLIIDILCHSDFENGDMRSLRIGDRLNQLLVSEHIVGIWKMSYVRGRQIARVPSQYVGFQHVYEFEAVKK